MKANESRIGNLVTRNDIILQICSISDSGIIDTKNQKGIISRHDIKYLNPIPLTEEWLERFGFHSKYKSIHNVWRAGSFSINQASDVDDDNNPIEQKQEFNYDYTYYPELKYVHQLQNLFFVMTGQELEYDPK